MPNETLGSSRSVGAYGDVHTTALILVAMGATARERSGGGERQAGGHPDGNRRVR